MKLRLREHRVARGLTQRQVADVAGYSVSYITEIENGTKQVNARMMERLSAALTELGKIDGFEPVTPANLILDESDPAALALAHRIAKLSPDQKDAVVRLIQAFLDPPQDQ